MFGGVERLLLRRTCAFSLVVVKVLFFPLCIKKSFCVVCTVTHESAQSLLKFLFQSKFFYSLVKVAFETKRRFFSNAQNTRSDDIFLCFLPPTPTQRRDI